MIFQTVSKIYLIIKYFWKKTKIKEIWWGVTWQLHQAVPSRWHGIHVFWPHRFVQVNYHLVVWNLFFVYKEKDCAPQSAVWRFRNMIDIGSLAASEDWHWIPYLSSHLLKPVLPSQLLEWVQSPCMSLLSNVAVEIPCNFSHSVPGSISSMPWLPWSHLHVSEQQPCTIPRPHVPTFTACAFLSLCLIRRSPFSQAGLPPLLDFIHWEMESSCALRRVFLKRYRLRTTASQESLSSNSLNRKRFPLLKFRVPSFFFDSPVFLETTNSTIFSTAQYASNPKELTCIAKHQVKQCLYCGQEKILRYFLVLANVLIRDQSHITMTVITKFAQNQGNWVMYVNNVRDTSLTVSFFLSVKISYNVILRNCYLKLTLRNPDLTLKMILSYNMKSEEIQLDYCIYFCFMSQWFL